MNIDLFRSIVAIGWPNYVFFLHYCKCDFSWFLNIVPFDKEYVNFQVEKKSEETMNYNRNGDSILNRPLCNQCIHICLSMHLTNFKLAFSFIIISYSRFSFVQVHAFSWNKSGNRKMKCSIRYRYIIKLYLCYAFQFNDVKCAYRPFD